MAVVLLDQVLNYKLGGGLAAAFLKVLDEGFEVAVDTFQGHVPQLAVSHFALVLGEVLTPVLGRHILVVKDLAPTLTDALVPILSSDSHSLLSGEPNYIIQLR